MRGSMSYQVTYLFRSSGINQIGASKNAAKESAREIIESSGKGATSSRIAEHTGIHSHGTATTYIDKWKEFANFAKAELGVKDIEKITAEHVREYLTAKMEEGVSYSTWQGNAAALSKLENALEMYAVSMGKVSGYGFRQAIAEVRAVAAAELDRFTGTRNYQDSRALIDSISNDDFQLAAKLQLEAGVRVSEASLIKPEQLRGLGRDEFSGRVVGIYEFEGKGGKVNTAQLSPETYERLANHIAANGEFRFNPDTYRMGLEQAASDTGQKYQGSHGLRWSFAQERFHELQENGVGYLKALGVVSDEMGHNRTEITEHYLGK